MKNKDKKNLKENKNKNESDLVTKESFSAALMLFSVLALLMLCTKSLIFGEVGVAVHIFLIGTLGYFAYPLLIGSVYLFFMMLAGKRLVKNRKAGTMLALSIVFFGLTLQAIMTNGWATEGYLEKCFEAGENFPTSTVCGLFGGLIIYGLRLIASKIFGIIILAGLCLLCLYLFIRFLNKKKTTPAGDNNEGKKKVKESKEQSNAVNQNAVNQNVAPQQVQNQQPTNRGYAQPTQNQMPSGQANYGDMRFTQRPGVRLTEGDNGAQNSNTYGFSPFGGSTNEQPKKDNSLENSYKNAREFLFGTGATESYKQNLIFDPTANVNNLPQVDPIPMQPMMGSNYTPSYTDAYQDSFNEDNRERPAKIVTNNVHETYPQQPEGYFYGQEQNTVGYEQTPYRENVYQQNDTVQESNPFFDKKEEETIAPIEPLRPIQEIPTPTDTPYYGRTEFLEVKEDLPMEQNPFARNQEMPIEQMQPEETQEENPAPYRRHNYMDLFAVDNPRELNHDDLFKPNAPVQETAPDYRQEEDYSFGGRLSRNDEDVSPFVDDSRDSRSFRNDEENVPFIDDFRDGRSDNERNGLNLFDEEPEDNPYELRSEFESRGRGYDEMPPVDSRNEEEFLTDRGRVFEESPADLPPPIEQPRVSPMETPKAANVEPPKPTPPKKPRIPKPYVRISLDDLDCRDVEPTQNQEEVENAKATIIATLEEFKVSGATIASVTFGPTVTRYNVTLPRGIMPSKVVALDQLIAMNLFTEGVSIYPNFKDGVVSVEVPNKDRQFVQLGSMLSGDSYVNAKSSSLMFAMGKDVANKKIYGDISKMIHLLVAGASGSGKSVFLGALIISLIHKYSPEELRLILIDPKKTEFVLYNDLPHLMINEIITDAGKAVQSLNWAIDEMNRRYGLFQEMSNAGTYVVNLDQYNEKTPKNQRLPKIVIIIDELADLMLAAKKDMEEKIQNLTQKARAAGIHLIVATQRPSTDVITGVIKSNLPTRIAFGVATDVDSRVILDQTGAQKLLGKGDFLYTMQGLNSPVRVQSAFISPEESQKVVNFIKENNEAYYDEDATAYINNTRGGNAGDSASKMDRDNVEPVYIDALRYVIISGSASISMIQRKCSAGYNKAGKIIEWMELMGYISPFDGAKARKVLISKEDFESKYGPLDQ